MLGLIFSILAGALMSIQGVINTRVTEKIGVNETNILVQGTGLLVAVVIYFIWGNGNFKNIQNVNKFYLLGGCIGAFIIFLVIKGINSLGATYAISAILISQLLMAAAIDGFGLLGVEQSKFGLNKVIGAIAMIIGIIIFKLK